jgi:hypothetical protein
MTFRTQSRRTLVLRPPVHCEDTITATERWLLSLWQLSRKTTWRLWRDAPAVALEYVGDADGACLQASMRAPLAASYIAYSYNSHQYGIEVTASQHIGLWVVLAVGLPYVALRFRHERRKKGDAAILDCGISVAVLLVFCAIVVTPRTPYDPRYCTAESPSYDAPNGSLACNFPKGYTAPSNLR